MILINYKYIFLLIEIFTLIIFKFLYQKQYINFMHKLCQKKKIINTYISKEHKYNVIKNKIIKYKEKNIFLKRKFKKVEIICIQNTEKLEYLKSCQQDNINFKNIILQQTNKIAELKSEIKVVTNKFYDNKIYFHQKEKFITDNYNKLYEQFQKLTNKIDEQNNNDMINNLYPFKKQIETFQKIIEENIHKESIERNIFIYELKKLKKLNMHISQEANNLTQALKGNNKLQGNWGEFILIKILEESGLRQGHEYELQKKIYIIEHEKTLQPDVIIKLPNNNNIIIDAKVTLVSYEEYYNSDDKIIRKQALNKYILSIKNHLRLLYNKNYHDLYNVTALDYIIMFIPIESAFLLAINHTPSMLYEALKYNIMITCPTTLMIALKTIYNLWTVDKKNENAILLANKATKLYNKIKLFIDDILTFEKNLNKLQHNYSIIMKKLLQGRSNIVTQAESFKDLGIEVTKKINTNFINK
ncbi:DNA recombination protein RmuC [Enterobacteriaceae endosymbiont of Macroplea appendiculata]|uniref:DNA recombination protein RmuC n=1 Tax=Enterobacteriaceae endosymbiont of Macroplea appendiculata TaxID=2675790 RepID=UPI00144929F7|nr:DNA recombination protein RmuC [Enterobacteriaceae endosymbiont of Macroplea appendiculata]QJC30893.1 DNA recombination protein RmuC [Enterobacteriaceae endosymbiont of Macroplea appendiculata]